MKIIFTIILSLTILIAAPGQKKADLKYNLELNKAYRVKSNSVVNSTQTVQGREQSVQTTNTVVFALKPLKKTDSSMIAEVKFDTIITVISMPQMDINSSLEGDIKSSDPAKVMECILNRMCNSTFLVNMSNTGRVLNFINYEQTSAGILHDIDSIQGQMAEFLKSRAKMMVEENSVKSMIESVTAYLPGKKVKIGEKWDAIIPVSSGGMDMTINATFKLNSIEGNAASISADLITESGSKTMEMNGAQITPDIRGIGKTEITVDINTGWIIKESAKQQLKGDLNVNAQGRTMQIPMEINSDTEIKALP